MAYCIEWGGTPRAIGIIPFMVLSFFMLPSCNSLILIIGIFALIDDILGRKKSPLGIEWGQLSRGIGMLLVVVAGFASGFGVSSILIALMIQPLNISDMQPGSTCIVTMIMSVITILLMLTVGSPMVDELPAAYTPLLLFVVCAAYSPLDFSGKIMLGEVGNHTFAIALGVSFYFVGGLSSVPLVCLSVLIPVPHCLDDCGFVILPEVWESYASCLVFVPQNYFGNSGSFVVLVWFLCGSFCGFWSRVVFWSGLR